METVDVPAVASGASAVNDDLDAQLDELRTWLARYMRLLDRAGPSARALADINVNAGHGERLAVYGNTLVCWKSDGHGWPCSVEDVAQRVSIGGWRREVVLEMTREIDRRLMDIAKIGEVSVEEGLVGLVFVAKSNIPSQGQ